MRRNIITFNHLHRAGILWRWISDQMRNVEYWCRAWARWKHLRWQQEYYKASKGADLLSNDHFQALWWHRTEGPWCFSSSHGGYIKVNGCLWLHPILSLENSGWCITTEVSFLSKYSDFSYNLVVKKVKSNDRQFTCANMTCFYSFHSNFGGKFLFALFFIFQVFQRFHWKCMRAQHLFIGVCRQS